MKTTVADDLAPAVKESASGVGHKMWCTQCKEFRFMTVMITETDSMLKQCQNCGSRREFVLAAGVWMLPSIRDTLADFADARLDQTREKVLIRHFVSSMKEAERKVADDEEPATELERRVREWMTAEEDL